MSGINDKATVVVELNGAQAKAQLAQLKQKATECESAIAKMRQVGDKTGMQKRKKELAEINRQIAQMTSATEGVTKALSAMDKATPKELNSALKTLQRQLKNMERGSDAWNSHVAKIKQLKSEIARVNAELQPQGTLLQRLNGWWNNVQTAVLGATAALTGVIMAGRKAVNEYAQMEEQLAETRKYTGLTAEQVENLNNAFKRMDTRTGRDKLNELAQEAGRLGFNTEEAVKGYVEAADIINVALVDLGSGATQEIAKLTNIFGVQEALGTRDAMLSVGSAVNVLSQNCTASKPYLVEFTQRLAGIGAESGMSIPQILAFGATLDANGQKCEMSASALSRLIMMLFQEPKKIANMVGLDVAKFTETLKKSTNDGVMMFLNKLKELGSKDALASLAPLFKDLGMDGVRMSQVLANLAAHLDMLKWEQGEAAKAFREATSATKEYVIFNSTVQASIDKARKRVAELGIELGEKLLPIMSHVMTSTSAIMRVLNIVVDFIINYKNEIIGLSAAIAYYTTIIRINAAETKAWSIITAVANSTAKATRISAIALNAVYALLTGNVTKATAATRALNIALKGNLLGMVIGLVGVLVGWFVSYHDKAEKAKQKQEELNRANREFKEGLTDISKTANEYAKNELARSKTLYSAATNLNKSKEDRIKAATKLIKQYPEYFGKLNTEIIMTGQAKSAYDSLTKSILKSAEARAAADKITENTKGKMDKEADRDKSRNKMFNVAKQLNKDKAELQNVNAQMQDEASIDAKQTDKWKKLFNRKRALEKKIEKNEKVWQSYSENVNRLQSDIKEIDKANEKLANTYNLAVEDSSAVSTAPEQMSLSKGYVSQIQEEKEAKKAELERKRQERKEKADFKEAINSKKGEWEANTADNIYEYAKGEKDYDAYLKRKEELDEKYITDRMALYENAYKGMSNYDELLRGDEDYQELLKKLAEKNKNDLETANAKSVKALQKEYKREAQELQVKRLSPNDALYQDEMAYQEKSFRLKVKYLEQYRDVYEKGSKEWTEYEEQRQDAMLEDKLAKRRMYEEKFSSWMGEYEQMQLDKRLNLDLSVLDAMLQSELIKKDDYDRIKAKLQREYQESKEERDNQYQSPTDKSIRQTSKTKSEGKRKLKELEEQHAKGLISDEAYEKRKAEIVDYYNGIINNSIASAMDSQTAMLYNLGAVWKSVFDKMSEDGTLTLDNIKDVASATFAAMSSALETYSQFANAEYEIKLSKVTEYYDNEINRAEGNSYKVAKLEEEKEERLSKLKSEATKNEFNVKVIEAVAQTAQNALAAYGAGWQMGPAGVYLAPLFAGIATANGMVQVALLKKQQQAADTQGYADGGFTPQGGKYEEVGVVHAGEWVASQELLASPVARPLINALDYVQRTNTIGTLNASDVSRAITAPQSLSMITEGDSSSAAIVATIAQNAQAVDRLAKRLNDPFITVNTVTGDLGIKKAQEEYETLIRNKSKRK